jgi:hypothetical protein
MSLNSEEEKESLRQSLKNTENLNDTILCLERVLAQRTPFALYIATADRTDCAWIFDPQTVYQMVGGEDKYDRILDSLFPSEEEKSCGVVFFIFRKVGPIYSIRVDLELIDGIINDLYDEL